MRYSRFFVVSEHQAKARFVSGKTGLALPLVYACLLELATRDKSPELVAGQVTALAGQVQRAVDEEVSRGKPKPRRRK